jgi:pimeloyl-ACP methyl ester carboxylesterase
LALLEALDMARMHVIGHSYGAVTALQLTVRGSVRGASAGAARSPKPASSMQVRHPRLPQNLPTQLGPQAENISCRYGRPALHPRGSPLDSVRGLDKAQYRASQNQ